jgi:hypothetical protein
LVCVLSVVEPCRSFAVAPNRQTQRLEVRPRKCLHYYLYLIDPEFGWMHVRLQTWAPYEIQVYLNGREWLARQLEAAGIGYRRSDNKITAVDEGEAVAALCERFAHTDWPWSAKRPWSIRCCPPSRTPAFPATDRPMRIRQRHPVYRARGAGGDPGRSGDRCGHGARRHRRPALPRRTRRLPVRL